MNPPPLPPRPIRRKLFEKFLEARLGRVELDYKLIEDSHQQAEAWINQNPAIEIVQIQTFHSSVNAVTVVWYRE
jgi:hypothetical protein